MADEEYVPGAGDVEIELDGKKVLLKPSLGACLLLSQGGEDGPRRLADKAVMLNIHAIAKIISAGTGTPEKDLLEPIFNTGVINLFGKCVGFVHIVSNGGRLPKNAGEGKENDADPQQSS